MTTSSTSPFLSRRDFTKIVTTAIGSIMGLLVGLPIIGYIISPAIKVREVDDWVSLGAPDDFPLGTPTLFSFTRTKVNGWEHTTNSYGVYVLRKEGGELHVFSNVCTHLSCRVKWREQARAYVCPCHEARFDIDGNVLYGPPPRPMDEYEYKIEEGNIIIHLTES